MKEEELELIRKLIREEISIAIKLIIGNDSHSYYKEFLKIDEGVAGNPHK